MLKASKGAVIAVSAPSGTGKTTIIKQILAEFPDIVFSVSATTRKKRKDEINGKDYFFISEEEFKRKINAGEFVEWEKFYDYYYGTFKSYIDDNINKGYPVLLEIDVKGALQVKKIYPDAVLIFFYPPDFKELAKRLKGRKTESEADFKKRLERAQMELSLKNKFDYLIENKNLDLAVNETKSLIKKIINKENV